MLGIWLVTALTASAVVRPVTRFLVLVALPDALAVVMLLTARWRCVKSMICHESMLTRHRTSCKNCLETHPMVQLDKSKLPQVAIHGTKADMVEETLRVLGSLVLLRPQVLLLRGPLLDRITMVAVAVAVRLLLHGLSDRTAAATAATAALLVLLALLAAGRTPGRLRLLRLLHLVVRTATVATQAMINQAMVVRLLRPLG